MNVASLTVGSNGLTSLFKTALDAWEFVDAASSNEGDCSHVKTSLDCQRAAFLIWAQRLGLFSSTGYNKAINSPHTRADQIAEALKHIALLFCDTNQLIQQYGFKITNRPAPAAERDSQQGNALSAIFGVRYSELRATVRGDRQTRIRSIIFSAIIRRQKDFSVWKNTTWTITGQKKATLLVDQITALVSDLVKFTCDIPATQTMEQLAAETVVNVNKVALVEIEQCSRGRENVISIAVSTRLSMLEGRTIDMVGTRLQTLVTGETDQISHVGRQGDDDVTLGASQEEEGTQTPLLDFLALEVENRQACKELLKRFGPVSSVQRSRTTNLKRILWEMTQWVDHTDPSGWFTISPISDSRIDSFLGTIRGPVGTPYEAGIFHVRINTDMPYPFAAPRVWFLTRILHPNVDAHGAICMSTFGNSNENGWSPAMTMETLLVSVASLLDEPNWDDPVDGVLPLEWTPDREEFKVRAREWTRRYATGRIVYPGERDDGFYTVSEVPTNSQAATLVETE